VNIKMNDFLKCVNIKGKFSVNLKINGRRFSMHKMPRYAGNLGGTKCCS